MSRGDNTIARSTIFQRKGVLVEIDLEVVDTLKSAPVAALRFKRSDLLGPLLEWEL